MELTKTLNINNFALLFIYQSKLPVHSTTGYGRLLFITLFLAMVSMASCHSKVFNVPGIYRTFTFPSEAKTAKVQLWGAGVGAAITTSGGNSGAYVECVIEVKNKKFVFVVGESGKNDVLTNRLIYFY
jgi:hypothetical protein